MYVSWGRGARRGWREGQQWEQILIYASKIYVHGPLHTRDTKKKEKKVETLPPAPQKTRQKQTKKQTKQQQQQNSKCDPCVG